MEKLGIEIEEELKKVNPAKLTLTFLGAAIAAIGDLELKYRKRECYEQRLADNHPTLTDFSVSQEKI